MAVSKNEFQKCFETWIKYWNRCIAADGDYFNGDHMNFDD